MKTAVSFTHEMWPDEQNYATKINVILLLLYSKPIKLMCVAIHTAILFMSYSMMLFINIVSLPNGEKYLWKIEY